MTTDSKALPFIIADAGSTKTDWRVVACGRELQKIATKGLNPVYASEEEISREIASALVPQLGEGAFSSLFFYGAGCLPEKIAPMRRLLGGMMGIRKVEVESDMLAAARGLSGSRPAIVCILGTGSNSCLYDGEKIIASVSPLGFILGDEGSGAVLGKLMIGDLLKNQLPAGLKEKFLDRYCLTPSAMIEAVYRKPFPSRFLASFSPFIAEHIDLPQIREMVKGSFRAFIERNVMQYDYRRYVAHFAGSIAFHYRPLLEEVAGETGLCLGVIAKSPMSGLIEYHSESGL